MFVAARVSAGSEVIQPRRMVKVGPADTCGFLLQTLLDKTGTIFNYSIDSIAAFADVKELDSSRIKLDISDDMSNIIDLGYKFFLFDIVLKPEAAAAAIEVPQAQYVAECTTPRSLTTSTVPASSQGSSTTVAQTPQDFTPNLERSQEPLTDGSEKSESLHYICVCGRSVLHSTRTSHEKYCSAYKAWKAAEDSRTESAAAGEESDQNERETGMVHSYKCECGSGFDSEALLDDHCKGCDGASHAACRCCCGKYFSSVEAHSSHIPLCPKCRRCAKTSAFPEYYRKIFMCDCGDVFDLKSALVSHQSTCEDEVLDIPSLTCTCGHIILQPWNLTVHMKTCSVMAESQNSKDTTTSTISSATRGRNNKRSASSAETVAPSPDKFEMVKQRHSKSISSRQGSPAPSPGVKKETLLNDFEEADKFEKIKLRRSRKEQRASKPEFSSGALKMPEKQSRKRKRKAANPDTQFEVDMILLHTGTLEKVEDINFLIRWKGYDSSEDCWLPYDECRDLKALDDYCVIHTELSPLLDKN